MFYYKFKFYFRNIEINITNPNGKLMSIILKDGTNLCQMDLISLRSININFRYIKYNPLFWFVDLKNLKIKTNL